MLMITRSEGSDLTHTLKVEGKLLGPWIGELESACRESNSTRIECFLDLARLTFVDAEGAQIAERRLIRDGLARRCVLGLFIQRTGSGQDGWRSDGQG